MKQNFLTKQQTKCHTEYHLFLWLLSLLLFQIGNINLEYIQIILSIVKPTSVWCVCVCVHHPPNQSCHSENFLIIFFWCVCVLFPTGLYVSMLLCVKVINYGFTLSSSFSFHSIRSFVFLVCSLFGGVQWPRKEIKHTTQLSEMTLFNNNNKNVLLIVH